MAPRLHTSLRFNTLVSAAIVLSLASPAGAQSQPQASRAQACPGAFSMPGRGANSTTLCLVNYERAVRGLAKVRLNPALAAAASRHSRDMAARNYFSHDTLGGGSFETRLLAAHYMRPDGAWSVGENLAWGTGVLSTPAATVESWMHSPAHRRNMLNAKFREIGVGVVTGSRAIYTADFGRRG
jgi:uncharacterized protein YkwD